MTSVIFPLELLHYQTCWGKKSLVLSELQCLVLQNMRWCEIQEAIHLWRIRLVSSSEWDQTCVAK